MSAVRSPRRVELEDGGLVVIDDARDTVLSVIEGSVWITEEGDPRDVILDAGAGTRLRRSGRSVVSALGRSAIALMPA